ncbi:hypothetical protein QP027_11415 [Corynebacterium breve]|uniref:Uncharacterized protein n=1 Tax=Corynebacterium breve TaxID=3049799 RepID=A0ABY8VDD2_9CORY|nr:hypothetical protein [Corynebacterium breve]WIM67674.1 hypothetical protein QP027_11415 [Corynebacterium breve]
MFHVKHYVRTTLTVPGAGTLITVAELVELNAQSCTLIRMIELAPDETIMGAFAAGRLVGQANQPLEQVPHPDTYDQFEGIEAVHLTADEFEGLWAETRAKFPEL